MRKFTGFAVNIPQVVFTAVAFILAFTVSPWWLALLVIHVSHE